ncbi:hypothetical protein ACFQGX_26975 [Nonomuraea dietziae]|uniref:hypothetical protein n=1 Tax=Nonomuraea dietziae TaxID=65515 RepID=UPI00361999C2
MMLRFARAALYTAIPAEVLLVTLLIAGVPLPTPVLVAGETLVMLVLALEAVTAYRLFSASRGAGLGRRAALSATYEQLVPAKVRRLLEFELNGMVSLGLWVTRRRHGVPPGATALSYSKEQSTTILLVLFMMIVELVAVDLLMVAFDVPAPIRVAVLVLDLYGVLFGLAFGAACVTRPHVLTDDELRIRCGAYFDLRIPRAHHLDARLARLQRERHGQGRRRTAQRGGLLADQRDRRAGRADHRDPSARRRGVGHQRPLLRRHARRRPAASGGLSVTAAGGWIGRRAARPGARRAARPRRGWS